MSVDEPEQSVIVLAPGARVLLLTRHVGEDVVAEWCAEVLAGGAYSDPARPSLSWIGGRHAASAENLRDYWPRVWAARALLYAWTPSAEAAVLAGLHDPSWRVREMCAKVVRRRALRRAEPILRHLLDDRVARVRAVAEAALTELALSVTARR